MLGKLEGGGVVYCDFGKKKKMRICLPFLGTIGHQKLNLGPIWNFGKEQGSTEFIPYYGV